MWLEFIIFFIISERTSVGDAQKSAILFRNKKFVSFITPINNILEYLFFCHKRAKDRFVFRRIRLIIRRSTFCHGFFAPWDSKKWNESQLSSFACSNFTPSTIKWKLPLRSEKTKHDRKRWRRANYANEDIIMMMGAKFVRVCLRYFLFFSSAASRCRLSNSRKISCDLTAMRAILKKGEFSLKWTCREVKNLKFPCCEEEASEWVDGKKVECVLLRAEKLGNGAPKRSSYPSTKPPSSWYQSRRIIRESGKVARISCFLLSPHSQSVIRQDQKNDISIFWKVQIYEGTKLIKNEMIDYCVYSSR